MMFNLFPDEEMYDHNFSILIVEDDEEQSFFIQELLKRAGFDAKSVATGTMAIDYIVQHPDTLILLDYNLPDINGKQVVEALKKIDYKVEFITMTAFGNEKVAVEMMKLGARDYIVKDANFLDFLPTVVGNTIDRIVTEQKLHESQEALRVTKERYYDLFENSKDAIYFTSKDGSIIACNNSMLQLFEMSPEEMHNINVTDLYLYPKSREAFISEMEHNGFVKNYEVRLKSKSNSILYCIISATPRKSHDGKILGYNGIIHDITGLKQAEDKLRESEARYRNLFENVPVGVYRTQYDGKLLDANPAMMDLLAFTDYQKLLDSNASDFYAYPLDRHKWLMKMDERGIIRSYEERLITQDSRVIWVQDSARAIKDENDTVVCYEGVMKDVTELKNSEEKLKRMLRSLTKSHETIEQQVNQLNQLNSQLELTGEELKQLNASKDKFFSIMAHDLKSPFTGFMGLTEMLSNDLDILSKEDIVEMSNAMSQSAKQIYQLLENLLEWSRLQNGSMALSPYPVFLSEVIGNIIDMQASNAEYKKIAINSSVDDSIRVFVDKNALQTILRNIIANAIKFTFSGGVINIYAVRKANDVLISINDNGIGMDSETHSKLFRIDIHHTTSGTFQEKGTGIGLILCKELIDASHGEIFVESILNEGSTFSFALPSA